MCISNIVPKNYRFFRDTRRYKTVEKFLRSISNVYGLFSKDVNDREAIGPVLFIAILSGHMVGKIGGTHLLIQA